MFIHLEFADVAGQPASSHRPNHGGYDCYRIMKTFSDNDIVSNVITQMSDFRTFQQLVVNAFDVCIDYDDLETAQRLSRLARIKTFRPTHRVPGAHWFELLDTWSRIEFAKTRFRELYEVMSGDTLHMYSSYLANYAPTKFAHAVAATLPSESRIFVRRYRRPE